MPDEYEDVEAAPEPDEEPHEWWDRLDEVKDKAHDLVQKKLQQYRDAVEKFEEEHRGA